MLKLTFKEDRLVFFPLVPKKWLDKVKSEEADKEGLEALPTDERSAKEKVDDLINAIKSKKELMESSLTKEQIKTLRPVTEKLENIKRRLEAIKDIENMPIETIKQFMIELDQALSDADAAIHRLTTSPSPSTQPQ
jgi:DNA repair exonuclease SbcCD ATPase subunit